MYRLNPLQRNVLITTDEVIFHAPTKHNLDPRTIQQSIIIAEERFIRPSLCDDFYEALIAAKNLEITDDNKAAQQALYNGSQQAGAQAYTLKNGDVVNAMEYLSDAYKTLWKQHLWKLTAECVMIVSTPEAFVQFTSEGAVHTNPVAGPMTSATVTTPDLRSMKWIMDKKLMDRIDPLIEAMHVWLCKRVATYPLYTKECDCDASGVAYQRKTNMILGLYDDDETKSCNCE
jgi:hypothetical protein